MTRRRGAESLLARAEALYWFLDAVRGVVPEERVDAVRTVVSRARERLGLSLGHTVVALAGATGGGKSSLFNEVCRLDLSAVGVRRPTTTTSHACVWGAEDSTALLDWLGVVPDRRFARESALDADDEATLRGLVLLDLPDFDSVVDAHRVEVERLLALVDVVIWITDPQKYADQLVHEGYLRAFHRHRDIMVVVLNQADRLGPAGASYCVSDLRRLLESEGLAGVPVFATSVVGAPGTTDLRTVLERAVVTRRAALRRLDDDLNEITSDLAELIGPEPAERGTEEALVDGLLRAAGAVAVAEAAGRAYGHRAAQWLRWLPVLRPWRRRVEAVRPVPTQRAEAGLAVRAYRDRVAAGLPEPWPEALDVAARSNLSDLPSALDRALARADLGASRIPWWWSAAAAAQWLFSLTATAALAWLATGPLAAAFGGHPPPDPSLGPVPLAALVAMVTLITGAALRLLLLPVAVGSSRLVQEQAARRLRAAVFEVAREQVVGPVRIVLGRYARASAALAAASGTGDGEVAGVPGTPAGQAVSGASANANANANAGAGAGAGANAGLSSPGGARTGRGFARRAG